MSKDFWLLLHDLERFLTRSRTAYVCLECGYEPEPESDAQCCPDHPDAELVAVRLHVIAELLAHLESMEVRRSGAVANDNRHVVSAPQHHAVKRRTRLPDEVVDIWEEAWQAWDRGRAAAASVIEAVAYGSPSDCLEGTPAPWCQLSLPAPAPAIERPWCQLFLPALGCMPPSAQELQRTEFFACRRRCGLSVTADMDPSTPAQ